MSRAVAKHPRKKTRAEGAEIVRNARDGRIVESSRLVLRQGDKAVGVVISLDELRYFENLEDRLDVRDAEKALANPKRIPYAEVRRRKLGL